MSPATAPILQAKTITKRFPGVLALDGVSFDLQAGEIHALCGENGAGKSTLIKLLSGIHPHGSYEGQLLIEGTEARLQSIADAATAGIAVIYQELALVDEMSVAENIFLGSEPRRCGGLLVDWQEMEHRTRQLLERFSVQLDPLAKVAELGVGQKQLVEIIKALAKQSRILILDEPSAALAEHEVQVLLKILRELKARGMACIYISHKLEEVFAVADRITVLRDGTSISTRATADTNSTEIIRDMVGRDLGELFPRRSVPPGDSILQVSNLSVQPPHRSATALQDISFDLHAGEVLGIGGLMGAGRTELLMHLFGAWGHRSAGRVLLLGEDTQSAGPGQLLQRGMALVSEDRRRFGLILEQGIGFNLSLSSMDQISHLSWILKQKEQARNQSMVDALKIKTNSLHTPAGTLSGGNQQKVVLGKILLTQPKVVLLDEPTRGIDVGAKLEIYELINQLTAQGCAVILVSSELPELIGMSDRILMLNTGRVGGSFDSQTVTQAQLMAAALGNTQAAA